MDLKEAMNCCLIKYKSRIHGYKLGDMRSYMAMDLLKESGFELEGPTTLHIDNQSAIQFANNSGFHARSKHIDIQ